MHTKDWRACNLKQALKADDINQCIAVVKKLYGNIIACWMTSPPNFYFCTPRDYLAEPDNENAIQF